MFNLFREEEQGLRLLISNPLQNPNLWKGKKSLSEHFLQEMFSASSRLDIYSATRHNLDIQNASGAFWKK